MLHALFIVVVLATQQASPAPPTVESAEDAFARGDFAEAADTYAQLYAEGGDPVDLYNGAQARRHAEQWAEAADLYERFVAEAEPLVAGLDEPTRTQLERMIANAKQQADACREQIETTRPDDDAPERDADESDPTSDERAKPPTPRDTTPPTPPPDPAITPADRPVQTRWSRDPAAISLVTVGAVLVVGGAAMLIAADLVDRGAEDSASDHEAFLARIDQAAIVQKTAAAPLAVGAALVVGGGIRFAVVRKRARVQPTLGGFSIRF